MRIMSVLLLLSASAQGFSNFRRASGNTHRSLFRAFVATTNNPPVTSPKVLKHIETLEANRVIKKQLDEGLLTRIHLNVDEKLREMLRLNKKKRNGRIVIDKEKSSSLAFVQSMVANHLDLPRDAFKLHSNHHELYSSKKKEKKGKTSNPQLLSNEVSDGVVDECIQNDEQLHQAWKLQQEPDKCIRLHVSLNEEDPHIMNTLLMKSSSAQHSDRVPSTPHSFHHMQMISFYSFKQINYPQTLLEVLQEKLKPIGCLGRIYISHEGINAQVSVPDTMIESFREICDKHIQDSDMFLNLDNIVTKEEFNTFPPFINLHIRNRNQIVADGLLLPSNNSTYSDDTAQTDAQVGERVELEAAKDGVVSPSGSAFHKTLSFHKKDCGNLLSPEEWNKAMEAIEQNAHDISTATDATTSDMRGGLILDCRNLYESDVGRFENAIPLKVDTFKESWDELDRLLEGKHPDTPILTYCTGGIR
jgi:predicted sulfurtransferase